MSHLLGYLQLHHHCGGNLAPFPTSFLKYMEVFGLYFFIRLVGVNVLALRMTARSDDFGPANCG